MRRRFLALVCAGALACLGHSGSATAQTPALVAPVPGGTWAAFFEDGPLQGSGWATCPEPISLSIDSVGLPRRQALKAARAVVRSLQLWERESGLRFAFTGVVPVDYDDRTGVITARDGVERRRHLYFALLKDADSSILSDRVVGLGEPTAVDPTNREIVGGEGTFKVEYVASASEDELVALFSHELGHALGLGHSGDTADVMFPIVSTAKRLGPGDVAGIKSITRPCVTAPQSSRDYPLGGSS